MNASTPAFFDAVKARRSIYVLDDKPTTDDARIEQLATDALQYVPSAFNSQSTRLAVLLHGEHKKFWTTTKETLGQGMREEDAKKKLGRLDGFASAVGTILFFENDATVKESQKRNPAYASMFPNWSEHTSGMHQFVLWTALEAEGYGCNLQHYHNPEVERKAQQIWGYSDDWAMKAQLVFGGRVDAQAPSAKDKLPLSETLKVYGKQ